MVALGSITALRCAGALPDWPSSPGGRAQIGQAPLPLTPIGGPLSASVFGDFNLPAASAAAVPLPSFGTVSSLLLHMAPVALAYSMFIALLQALCPCVSTTGVLAGTQYS